MYFLTVTETVTVVEKTQRKQSSTQTCKVLLNLNTVIFYRTWFIKRRERTSSLWSYSIIWSELGGQLVGLKNCCADLHYCVLSISNICDWLYKLFTFFHKLSGHFDIQMGFRVWSECGKIQWLTTVSACDDALGVWVGPHCCSSIGRSLLCRLSLQIISIVQYDSTLGYVSVITVASGELSFIFIYLSFIICQW